MCDVTQLNHDLAELKQFYRIETFTDFFNS
jgi:hypothetical protein